MDEWVKSNLKSIGIEEKNLKIKILCYPRILGYVFNPLSIFFIYNLNSKLVSILYEVKNTFGEQHTYIFRVNEESDTLKNNCEKFFVSPFMDLQSEYNFKILHPSKKPINNN